MTLLNVAPPLASQLALPLLDAPAAQPIDVCALIVATLRLYERDVGLWLHMDQDLRSQLPEPRPSFSIEVTPAWRTLVEQHRLIYGNDGELGQKYYLELIGNGRVFIKYQTILGFRHIATLDAAQLAQVIDACRRLAVPNQTPAPVAGDDGTSTESNALLAELRLLRLDGQAIVLPAERLQHFAAIKRRILDAGGRYRSPDRFVFASGIDVAATFATLTGGSTIRLQQETQFFETPSEVAHDLVAAAGSLEDKRVLEPSAGRGMLADLARSAGADITVVENWSVNAQVLREKGYDVVEEDFLTLTPAQLGTFDVILANPPFAKDADVVHVQHMLKFLRPGGVLCVIVGTRWKTQSQPKPAALRAWIESAAVRVTDLDAGTFRSSGTQIATTLLVYHHQPDAIARRAA